MALGVIADFIVALSLAILIECFVAIVFGFRQSRDILAVAAINLITNPILNYSILIIKSLNLFRVDFFVQLIFESVVILVEWRMLVFSVGESNKKLLILSLVMNLSSFASGLLLFNLI